MLVKVHDGKIIDSQVKELERPIAAGNNQLVLVDLGPGQVIERIVRVETGSRRISRTQPPRKLPRNRTASTYVFSTWMPCAVSPSVKTRPLPTMPKLADVATAMRES